MIRERRFEYQSDFAKQYVQLGREEGREEGRKEGDEQGRAEAHAEAILEVLRVRGLDISENTQSRIRNCGHLEQLERWLNRAMSASSTDEVFEAAIWGGIYMKY
ncbi:MAG: hypothetical protein AAFU77_17730 [Myxococcota bacterium]